MIDCQHLEFVEALHQQRISQAQKIFGPKVIQLILCFALYLLGMKRNLIAGTLEMQADTVKTFLKRIYKTGLSALEDRRSKQSPFLPPAEATTGKCLLIFQKEELVIDFGKTFPELKIPKNNKLQIRTVLLTLLNNNFLSINQVAKVDSISSTHIRNLANQINSGDVLGLVDKRQGPKQDLFFKSNIKAEIIQQCVANIISGKSASSEKIVKDIQNRCKLTLSARSVRYHIQKLGLKYIDKTLLEIIAAAKKNS